MSRETAGKDGLGGDHRASPPGGIEIWWTPLDDMTAVECAACAALLDEVEHSRFEAFKAEPARLQFLAGRGLLRTVLSRYRDVAPAGWRFRMNPYGRPFAVGAADLYFSLSHTEGIAICAVANFVEIGIDVERRNRKVDVAEMRQGVLAPEEALWIDAGEGEKGKCERFFALWTMKEAYAKARGMGLSLPMDAISFDLTGKAPIARFDDTIADDPRRWMFRDVAIAPELVVALAAAPREGCASLSVRRTRPVFPSEWPSWS